MAASVDDRITAIAAVQFSVFSRIQALRAGASPSLIDRRLRAGRWVVIHSGVYALPGVADTWVRRLWAAHLAAGDESVVSHESSAPLRRFPGFSRGPVVLTLPHGQHRRIRGAFVHQISDLRPRHVRLDIVDGLPVTTAPRTIVDLAPQLGARRLGDLVDDVVAARRTSYEAISDVLHEVLRPGKRGLARLAAVLDERGPGHVPPASDLERALVHVIDTAGLPLPSRQRPLPGRGAVTGVVDFLYLDARLIVETDGRRWHTRIKDLRRDHDRDAEAARAGYQTLRFLHEHVEGDPSGTAATIRDVRAARLAQLSRL